MEEGVSDFEMEGREAGAVCPLKFLRNSTYIVAIYNPPPHLISLTPRVWPPALHNRVIMCKCMC